MTSTPSRTRQWTRAWRRVRSTTGGTLQRSWLIRLRGQHRAHAVDLGRLIGFDVRGEAKNRRVLSRAWTREQLADHCECAFVVLDHEREKEAVELRTGGFLELCELLVAQHAGHEISARRGRLMPDHSVLSVG